MLRLCISLVGIVGAVLFWGVFVSSFVSPMSIESFARKGLQFELERRVQGHVSTLSNSAIATTAMKILGKNSVEIAALEQSLSKEIPSQVAKTIDKFLDPKCPCRESLKKSMREGAELKLSGLRTVNERLLIFVENKYAQVASALMRELRVFSAANAIGFSFLIVLVLLKPKAELQLVIPTLVLLASLLAVGYFYVFAQNWLHTLVFNDYVGYGYFAYLGAALVLFLDIAFNRCRISSVVFNSLASILGGLASAVPC